MAPNCLLSWADDTHRHSSRFGHRSLPQLIISLICTLQITARSENYTHVRLGTMRCLFFFLQSFLNNFIFTVVSNSRLFPYVRWPNGAKGWNFCWVISVKTTTFHFTWCWIRANEEIERKAESLEKTSKIDLKLTLEFYIFLSSARDTTSESNFFNLQTHNEYSGRNEKFISSEEREAREMSAKKAQNWVFRCFLMAFELIKFSRLETFELCCCAHNMDAESLLVAQQRR